ncbi:MAG: DUF1566 domain-containing protein [bacterium]
MRKSKIFMLFAMAVAMTNVKAQSGNYKIVDTGQELCYDNTKEITPPTVKSKFYGQDAQHQGNQPSYTDNGDGTITDNVTGLIWQKEFAVMSYAQAVETLKTFSLAGKKDWRIPTIKEAYSLMMFSGSDINPEAGIEDESAAVPFINAEYFAFKYGANGNRVIDSQMLSSTLYVGSSDKEALVFGVNFADGRIKGYGMRLGGNDKEFMVRFVRGNAYGENQFVDNGDGTISDVATSLMWSKTDSQKGMKWSEALDYAKKMNKINYLGFSDWRVPNAKELQSLVDYTRSPATTSSAAIDPMFSTSAMVNEAGLIDYPFYWTSTTHARAGEDGGTAAVYVAFGRSLGNMAALLGGGQHPGGGESRENDDNGSSMRGQGGPGGGGMGGGGRSGGGMGPGGPGGGEGGGQRPRPEGTAANWIDVHGAGSQRSDPKTGDASKFANGNGPQGDAIRINNYVRLVRDL